MCSLAATQDQVPGYIFNGNFFVGQLAIGKGYFHSFISFCIACVLNKLKANEVVSVPKITLFQSFVSCSWLLFCV